MSEDLRGVRMLLVGLCGVLFSALGAGCDDGRHGYYDYGYAPGPGYGGPRSRVGAIRFEWSLPGSANADAGAPSDEDAGVLAAAPDAGLAADAGVKAAGTANRAACDALGATQFQALLRNQGVIVDAFQSRCSASAGVLRETSNDYTATAALITDDGVPVTETEVIPSFIVAPGETQVIRVTFSKLASAP